MVKSATGIFQLAKLALRQSARYGLGLGLGLLGLVPQPGWALPGQPTRIVESWMRTHPTLRPRPHERLTINRVASPGQRFTFQASVFPVTGVSPGTNQRVIRTERFILVDHANDITPERLEESLRVIYGAQVFNDYRQGNLLLSYPNPQPGPPTSPGLVLQGEVREGEQFAYWQELSYDQEGNAYLGRMAIFLKEDLPLLREQLTGN
jgi:hypothetical protein